MVDAAVERAILERRDQTTFLSGEISRRLAREAAQKITDFVLGQTKQEVPFRTLELRREPQGRLSAPGHPDDGKSLYLDLEAAAYTVNPSDSPVGMDQDTAQEKRFWYQTGYKGIYLRDRYLLVDNQWKRYSDLISFSSSTLEQMTNKGVSLYSPPDMSFFGSR